MAKITVKGGDFANVVVCFLYDKLQHPEQILEADVNEIFNALAEVLMRRGMKAPLFQCYMRMDPQLRVRYRMIRNVFIDNGSTKTALIEIRKDERAKVLKTGTFDRIKKFVKKIAVLGLVAAVKKGIDLIKGKKPNE